MLLANIEGENSPTCLICLKTFASYRGRRVYHRLQHPDVFHTEEVEALSAASRKVRWDPGELAMMASFESQNPGIKYINQAIKARVLPHRTIESIKGARKTGDYRARLRALETHREDSASASAVPALPASSDGPNSPLIPGPVRLISNHLNQNTKLLHGLGYNTHL